MSITIRKGPFGWYVENPRYCRKAEGVWVETDPETDKKRILYLECTLKGFDPFPDRHDCRTMKTVKAIDVNGVTHTFCFNPRSNLLEYIYVNINDRTDSNVHVELDEDNGVWHFLVGKEYNPPQYPRKELTYS